MLETSYKFIRDYEERVIEKIIDDDNLALNHVILLPSTSLPEHYSNSNVYLIIVDGYLSIKLEEEKEQVYGSGSIVNVPFNTKMNISNKNEQHLEFFIVKAPNPKAMLSD